MSNKLSRLFDQVVYVVKNWWLYLLIFGVLVAIDACRDYVLFNVEKDSGYFSVHTLDSKDFWHHGKLLQWLIVLIALFRLLIAQVETWTNVMIYLKFANHGWIRLIIYFVIAIGLNWVIHEMLLHHTF